MQDKISSTRPRQRLLAAAITTLLAAPAVPALADAETDALKRELAEQRKLIEKLLADKEAKPAAAPAVAPAAAPAATPVTSSPNVRIYGILDGGVEHLSGIARTGGGTGSVTRMPSITATLPSRVGIAANKDIGDGYKGVGVAELGFNTDDGTLGQGGRIFGRQLYAGVETPFGAVTYGRQWSMLFHAMMGSDLMGPNIYALGSFDPYLASMRYDNSVAWRGKFGGFSAGALYSFARSVVASGGAPLSGNCAGENVNDTGACKGWSVMAAYDDAAWGVSGAIDEQKGGAGNTATGGPQVYTDQARFFNGSAPIDFTSSGAKDTRSNLGGYVKFGSLKVAGGWLGRKVATTAVTVKSASYYLGASYAVTPKVTVDGELHHTSSKGQDNLDRSANLYVVRGFYHLDKGLSAYAQIGHVSNSASAAYGLSVGAGIAPPNGGSQTGEMVGMRYMF